MTHIPVPEGRSDLFLGSKSRRRFLSRRRFSSLITPYLNVLRGRVRHAFAKAHITRYLRCRRNGLVATRVLTISGGKRATNEVNRKRDALCLLVL